MAHTKDTEKKDGRLQEIVRDLAAQFVQRESNGASIITITRVLIDDRGQRAMILFTTLPDSKAPVVEEFLNRQRDDFKQYVYKHSRIGRVPLFSFKVDAGEKNRQKADELLG